MAQSVGGIWGRLVRRGDEGVRALSSRDPGRQAGWDWMGGRATGIVWRKWAFHFPAVHCGFLLPLPVPGDLTAPRGHSLQVLLLLCLLGGYPGRSESLPAQLVSKRKYIPSDTQLSPKVTAIFKAHSGHLLFEAHHAGTFLYQYSNSYPCLLVKFFCPLLYLRWKLCIICVHTLISFWTKAILRKFSTQDLL